MPPRHGKSDSATQKFPSWVLGNHPDWPFIVASYSQELATDFGQGTRDLMDSPNYKAIFDTRLRQDTQAKAKWMTDKKGGYTAVGVGGAITGRGFKIGIVDDPFKNREEADSPVTRESVHKWWRSTFYTRQEGHTAIILILTRWHDDDLAGRLLKEQKEAEENNETDYDKWEVLEFKGIAEQDELQRKKGEALWPKKFDVSKLLKTKAALGSYEFSALYQQNPIDEDSQEFKKDWLQYRRMDEVEKMVTRKFATIDPAGSKKKKSDNTGVTRNWVNDLNEWHLKSRRYRINSKGIIDLIFELYMEGFEVIGIEEGVFTDAIEPFLKVEMEERKQYPNVVPLKHRGIMKETRIRGLVPRYENRKVYHIEGFCADLEEEYLRFPKSAFDDCLDTTAYQNQLAFPPSAGIGDRIERERVEQCLRNIVNEQKEPILISVSTTVPFHILIGNKDGVFFNGVADREKDLYDFVYHYASKWGKVFIFMDKVGEAIGMQKLQEKFPGKVYTCYLSTEKQTEQKIKWGDDEKHNEITISRTGLIQEIIDEMGDGRFILNGELEDWQPFVNEWAALFRVWEPDSIGNLVPSWESSATQGFVKSGIFFRVALSRFANARATIVGESSFMGIPKAQFQNVVQEQQVVAQYSPDMFDRLSTE